MALTSLETIAQKLEEKKQAELENILKISGSAAITKNEYNITVVNDSNVASSLLFKPLTKPKYNETELLKAIDVEIKELKPEIPVPPINLVSKQLYDSQFSSSVNLQKQVSDLTTQISVLRNEITTLNQEVNTEATSRIRIEQSNDVLINQLDAVNNTINSFSTQISTALQKSVEESILRASLQSQNAGFKSQIESLIKQVDSLNSIIEGLQSQLGAVQQQQAIQQGTQTQALSAGADVVGDNVIVKLASKGDQTKPSIWGKINAAGGNKWINGATVDFINNDKSFVEIRFNTTPTQGIDFFSPSEPLFILQPGEQKTINLIINESEAGGRRDVDSKKTLLGWSNSADYNGGELKITIIKSNGTISNKTYEAGFTKSHPKSY